MPTIKPITELRNTNEISEICHSASEPIFITKNGYGDLVIMSIETYESKLAKVDLYEKLAEAEDSLGKGMFSDGKEVFKRLREKYVRQNI